MELEIKKIISDIFEIPVDIIDDSTSPETVKEWDSSRHIELILSLEEKFNVTFDTNQIVNMINFSAILNVIKEVSE